MRRPPPKRHIALLIETSNRYARGILAGIGRHVREQGTWTISLVERGRGERAHEPLRNWRGDGILARIDHPNLASAIAASEVPVVDLCGARLLPSAPWVETDDLAIAQLAIEHLLSRGFRQLAFVGDRTHSFSRNRREHVLALAAARGIPCSAFQLRDDRRHLDTWMQTLPRPCGIICSHDMAAMQAIEAARRCGIPVPDGIAILGADDDESVCSLCTPALSSIALDAQGAGLAAARMLDALIDGARVATSGHLLPPLRVMERESTAGMAISDPAVLKAITAMRLHAARGLPVTAAARVAGIARRTLEQRFRSVLGRSPHDEVVRLRLEVISRLLGETELTLGQVAEHCGFINPEYLHVLVKREIGVSPGVWRKRLQSA